MTGRLEEKIKKCLEDEYEPKELEIENLSYLHRGHESIAGSTSEETHFKIFIVSDKFSDLNLVKRHQRVYKTIDFAFKEGLHAVELKCLTLSEVN